MIHRYHEGQIVRVKSKDQIAPLLDQEARTDGCLFTRQMSEHCGQEFEIIKVVQNFFDEHSRRIYKVKPRLYILRDSICNGQVDPFDQVCDHSCYLLWHEDWIERPRTDSPLDSHSRQTDQSRNAPSTSASRGHSDVFSGSSSLGVSGCQLLTLKDLSLPNSWIDELGQSRIGLIWSTKKRLTFLKNSISRLARLRKEKTVATQRTQNPISAGDMVRVKSKEQILAILDDRGATKGCIFTPEMFERCGQTYRVLKQVHYFYDEVKKRLCRCRDMVLLEGAVCSGRRRVFPADCDRNCFQFWHVSWLEKDD